MKWRALTATSLLLVSTSAFARTPHAHGRRHRPRRVDVVALRAAVIAHEAGRHAPAGDTRLRLTSAPAPSPAPAIGAVLPPGVLALLVAAASHTNAAPAATDGLSWREQRPQDESGRRIVPLAIGRF